MNDSEFANLKNLIVEKGGHRHEGYKSWDGEQEPPYWTINYLKPIFLEWNSNRSKYKGSIVSIVQIQGEKIEANCSVSGAPNINPNSHYKNFEITRDTEQKYVDPKVGNDPVKDFFKDDINVGDYVFGEYNRDVFFGIVRGTKKGRPNANKGYTSKIMKYDAAMVEIIKAAYRSDYNKNANYMVGEVKLLEMKYFIKIEDPTLYLLKI